MADNCTTNADNKQKAARTPNQSRQAEIHRQLTDRHTHKQTNKQTHKQTG